MSGDIPFEAIPEKLRLSIGRKYLLSYVRHSLAELRRTEDFKRVREHDPSVCKSDRLIDLAVQWLAGVIEADNADPDVQAEFLAMKEAADEAYEKRMH